MDKLKPCPFCKCLNINVRKGKWAWSVECTNAECGASITRVIKKEAIESWNRRASDE